MDWDNRHELFRKMTPSTMATQRRLVVLWAVPAEARVTLFQELAEWAALDASTKLNYWETFMGTSGPLQGASSQSCYTPTHLDKRLHRVLDQANKSQPPKPPIVLSPPQVRHIAQTLQERGHTSTATAFAVAVSSAQRWSDVIQVEAEGVKRVDEAFYSLMVSQGKTIKTTGPYPIFLPATAPVGITMSNLLHERGTAGRDAPAKLFGDPQTNTDRLRSVLPPRVSVLALRKTGAITMGIAKVDVGVVNELMMHRTIFRTRTYMESGRYELARAERVESAMWSVAQTQGNMWPWPSTAWTPTFPATPTSPWSAALTPKRH